MEAESFVFLTSDFFKEDKSVEEIHNLKCLNWKHFVLSVNIRPTPKKQASIGVPQIKELNASFRRLIRENI